MVGDDAMIDPRDPSLCVCGHIRGVHPHSDKHADTTGSCMACRCKEFVARHSVTHQTTPEQEAHQWENRVFFAERMRGVMQDSLPPVSPDPRLPPSDRE